MVCLGVCPKFLQYSYTVFTGKHDVQHYELRLFSHEGLKHRFALGKPFSFKAGGIEGVDHEIAYAAVVFDAKYHFTSLLP